MKPTDDDADEIIHAIIVAWEKLPGGRYSPRVIEQWMRDDMWPVVNRARKFLGHLMPPPTDAELDEIRRLRAEGDITPMSILLERKREDYGNE